MKNRTRRIVSAVLLLAFTAGSLLLLAGCASGDIDADADRAVVLAERGRATAFDATNEFLSFEHENRDQIKALAPAVHDFAEQLRRQSPDAFRAASAATKLYKQTRDAADADSMTEALGSIEALARQARRALIQISGAKLKAASAPAPKAATVTKPKPKPRPKPATRPAEPPPPSDEYPVG